MDLGNNNSIPKADNGEHTDPTFQVMPHLGKASVTAPLPVEEYPDEPEPSAKSRKLPYIIIGLVALLIIGALAYFLLGKKEVVPQVQAPVSKLPQPWLKNYFESEVCNNQEICGDIADPDKDGLNNYDEFKTGTTPNSPDTDQDGLADGDELNIYNTDPTLKYTDTRTIVKENDWTDGLQIRNGYDPLTPALKFSESRLTQIQANIAKYGLHSPTTETLDEDDRTSSQ